MSKRRLSRGVPTHVGMALVVGVAGGCIAAKKEAAGGAISRLTVRNLGSVIGLLNADTTCGFSSDAVVSAAAITGEPGTDGTVVFTVTGCTVTAADVVATDCSGDTKTTSGSFTADATLTIQGLITGDPASPVVPGDSDSVEFNFTKIDFNNFKVAASDNDNTLTNVSGSISAKVSPRFAVAADSGACAIATPNVTFTDITYSNDSVVFLDTADKDKEIEIGGGTFSAQNGTNADASSVNTISGNLVVLGRDVIIDADPTGDAAFDGKLDSAFDPALFNTDFACTDNLAAPDNFQCADVRSNVAFGSARFSALTFGIAAGIARGGVAAAGVAACPFAPIAAPTGNIGDDGSVLTLALAADCAVNLAAPTVVSTDCNGTTITVEGGFTVKAGSKLEVTGYNVGNAAVGVLPTSRAPALVTADIEFNEFSIFKATSATDDATPELTVHSGSLSGQLAPRFFLDTTSGACSVSSPILGTAPVNFADLTWVDGDVTLDSNNEADDTTFSFTLDDSALNAQSGDDVAATNTIDGSLSFSGIDITVPANTVLDEAFDQVEFNAAFQQNGCVQGLPATVFIGASDAQCSFRQALGQTAAKLLVGAAAGSLSASSNPALCGTSTTVVFNGNIPGAGNSVATTTACQVVLPNAAPATLDCTGGAVDVEGAVTVSAVTTTSGFRAGATTIVPTTQTSALIDGITLGMAGWIFEKLAGGVSLAKITLNSNITVGTFNPILAQADSNADGVGDEAAPGVPIFSGRTPIFEIVDLAAASGTATLVLRNQAGLLTFNIDLSNVSIDALVGAFGGESNDISGSLTVDGELVTVATGTPFDAAFSQAALDASYSCVNVDADNANNIILVPAN